MAPLPLHRPPDHRTSLSRFCGHGSRQARSRGARPCGSATARKGVRRAGSASGGRPPAVEVDAAGEHLLEPVCPIVWWIWAHQLGLPSPKQRPYSPRVSPCSRPNDPGRVGNISRARGRRCRASGLQSSPRAAKRLSGQAGILAYPLAGRRRRRPPGAARQRIRRHSTSCCWRPRISRPRWSHRAGTTTAAGRSGPSPGRAARTRPPGRRGTGTGWARSSGSWAIHTHP
jgi:hypothetical protein